MHYLPLLEHLRKYGIQKVYTLQRKGGELVEVEETVLNDPFWQNFADKSKRA